MSVPEPGKFRQNNEPQLNISSTPLKPVEQPPIDNTQHCPYCNKFTYQAVESVVSQEILDHVKTAHTDVWNKMQEDVAKIEQEFV